MKYHIEKVDYAVERLHLYAEELRAAELALGTIVPSDADSDGMVSIDYASWGGGDSLTAGIVKALLSGYAEEDYLASEVIPQTLQAPPVITDPVITDILLPVRDEEEWLMDEGIMAQLKSMCHDEQFPLEERARFIRLYELALAGWSYTFYRKGE